MELSVTTDGGARWLTSPVGSPNRLFADTEFTPAYVDFVDARHGWVVAMIATGSGVAAWRILLHTSDGGASCQRLPSPVGGPVEFVSPMTAWLTRMPSRAPSTPGRST